MHRNSTKTSTAISRSILGILCLLLCSCTFYAKSFRKEFFASEALRAESLTEQGKYREAIAAYKQHIVNRDRNINKLPNENTAFYYLRIGDLQLKLDEPEQAEKSYNLALEKDVNKPLSIERLRKLGAWYEQKGNFEKAFEIVKRYRHLDPLYFDLEVDRLHKALVEFERKSSRLNKSTYM